MRYAHTITATVFAKPEEDVQATRSGLLALFPFDLAAEGVPVEERRAVGFNERTITVLGVTLSKESHITAFLRHILGRLGGDQRELLLSQLETRLDAENKLFIRLDKQALLEERRWLLTDGGNCYHVRIAIAAYPNTREAAAAAARRLLAAA